MSMYTNCHSCDKSNGIIIFMLNHKKTQYSLRNDIYVNNYIHNVSHNSPMCLMIGAISIKIL